MGNWWFTGSLALPGNQCLEALPRKLLGRLEAEPPDLCYQVEPSNKYNLTLLYRQILARFKRLNLS